MSGCIVVFLNVSHLGMNGEVHNQSSPHLSAAFSCYSLPAFPSQSAYAYWEVIFECSLSTVCLLFVPWYASTPILDPQIVRNHFWQTLKLCVRWSASISPHGSTDVFILGEYAM